VTRLLKEWGGGNKEALDELMPVVYQQLRNWRGLLARRTTGPHAAGDSLVHEAYLRLVDANVPWQDRVHFFAVSARLIAEIRSIMPKEKAAEERRWSGNHLFGRSGHDWPATTGGIIELDAGSSDWRRLTRAKAKSSSYSASEVTYDEAAAALKVSPQLWHRDLKMAKAWLHRELTQNSA